MRNVIAITSVRAETGTLDSKARVLTIAFNNPRAEMRNTTRRKITPNSSSSEDRQLAHKKRYAYKKTLQSIRRIHENDGQNKRT
jgi:hypothetical protein